MNTPEEYFKKWAENCRIFTNYKAIHSHEDMMRFAKDYHNEQLRLNGVSGSANEIINYIENEAEIAIPINELMHEEGRHLTKKEYGHVLLKFLVKELREHYR